MTTQTQEFKLDLPLFVGGEPNKKTGKPNKRYWLTLNNYRNWHFQISNKLKVRFKEQIQNQMNPLPDLTSLWGQVEFHYVLFPPDSRLRDLNNSLGVVDKFFVDALVEAGKVADDNCNYVTGISCSIGTIDKTNPRMEVTIRPQKPKQLSEPQMAEATLFSPRKQNAQNAKMLPSDYDPNQRKTYVQITLEENEIVEAIRNYIRAQVPAADTDEMPVALVAGRGENGHSASITIKPVVVPVVKSAEPTEMTQKFAGANNAANARNGDPVTSTEVAESVLEAATSTSTPTEETMAEEDVTPEPAETESPFEETAAVEPQEEATQETAPAEKSSLFGGSSTPAPDAVTPAAPKSIFDS